MELEHLGINFRANFVFGKLGLGCKSLELPGADVTFMARVQTDSDVQIAAFCVFSVALSSMESRMHRWPTSATAAARILGRHSNQSKKRARLDELTTIDVYSCTYHDISKFA